MKIHIIGDSLVKPYGDPDENLIGSWGDYIEFFFDYTKLEFINYSMAGRSSRRFVNEGRFLDKGLYITDEYKNYLGPACSNFNKDDIVLIEFGHNDDESKIKDIERSVPLGVPNEFGIYPTVMPVETMLTKDSQAKQYGGTFYTYDCGATYKGFLQLFIKNIRQKQAIPVLISPVARQFYVNGELLPTPGQHGGQDQYGAYPYIRAVEQIAQEENVLYIDLFNRTKNMFSMLGEKYAVLLQCIKDENDKLIGHASGGSYAKWVEDYNKYIENGNFSRFDFTHQNRYGAFLVAANLIEGMFDLLEQNTNSWEIPQTELESFHNLHKYIHKTCELTVQPPKNLEKKTLELQSFFHHVRFNSF